MKGSRWFLLAGFILAVLGARLALLNQAGSDLPVLGQWDTEGEQTLRSWLEHRPAIATASPAPSTQASPVARLYVLALFLPNGQWDGLVEIVAGAFVHTLVALLLLLFARPWVRGGWLAVYGGLLFFLFALPYDWTGALIGLWVPFDLLLLFSLGQIWLGLRADELSWRWVAGQLCGLLALLTLPGGAALSSLAVLLITVGRAWRQHRWSRAALASSLLAAAYCAIGWAWGPRISPAQFQAGFYDALCWPGPAFLPLGGLTLLAFFGWLRSEAADRLDPVLAGFGLWGVFLCLFFPLDQWSLAGSVPPSPGPLAINVVAGFLLLLGLPSSPIRRWTLRIWLAAVGLCLATAGFDAWHDGFSWIDETAIRTDALRRYVTRHDPTALTGKNWPAIADRDGTALAARVDDPTVRRILPPSVRASLPVTATAPGTPLALSPACPEPLWPVFLSTYSAPPAPALHWRSARMPPPGQPFLRFLVAGDLGGKKSLRLVLKTDMTEIPVSPERCSRTRWTSVTVAAPASSWWIEAEDAEPAAWFAVSEPVEIGPLSWCASRLRKYYPFFLAAGLIALAVGGAAPLRILASNFWIHTRSWRPRPRRLWAAATRLFDATPVPAPVPRSVLVVLGGLWLLLALNLWFCVGLYQPNVMAWDQWDFFQPLFHHGSWWNLFRYQHGPHRQGAAFVLTSWVLAATHWDTRWDAIWIASLLAIAGLLALRLKWKMTGTLSLRDAWIPVVVLSLVQFESLLLTPNASHSIFPFTLLLAVANLWLATAFRWRWPIVGLGGFALTFTGFGVFSGLMVAALLGVMVARLAWARDWRNARPAACGLAIALLGLGAFHAGYVFAPAVPNFRFPWTPLIDYGRFVLLMLSCPAGFSEVAPASYVAGAAIAVCVGIATLAVGLAWLAKSRPNPRVDVLVLLIGAGLLYVCNTAVGRVCVGVETGMSSRYVSLMLPLWLAVYCAAAASGYRRWLAIATIAAWGGALCPYRDLPHRPISQWFGRLGLTDHHLALVESFALRKTAWVDTYLHTGDIARAQATAGMAVYPAPEATRMTEKLDFLRERHLSFFVRPSPDAYLPWMCQPFAIWNDEYPARDRDRVLDRGTRLAIMSARSGAVSLVLHSPERTGPGPWLIRLEIDGRPMMFHGDKLPASVAIPLRPGINRITFQSANIPLAAYSTRFMGSPTPTDLLPEPDSAQ